MNTKHLMYIGLTMIFGPPLCLALIAAGSLFMYLTEPWGWFFLFLLLGLPLGTIAVGLIIRVGYNNRPGFQPNARHPGGDEKGLGQPFRFRN